MADDKQMLTFVIERPLLRRIDDFRFEHRFPSRAAAIKWLLEAALEKGLHPTVGEEAVESRD